MSAGWFPVTDSVACLQRPGSGSVHCILALLTNAGVLERIAHAVWGGVERLAREGRHRVEALQSHGHVSERRAKARQQASAEESSTDQVAGKISLEQLNAARGGKHPRRPPLSERLVVDQIHAKFNEARTFELSLGRAAAYYGGLSGTWCHP